MFLTSGGPRTDNFALLPFVLGIIFVSLGITITVFGELARRRSKVEYSQDDATSRIALEQGFVPSLEDLARMVGKPSTNRQRDYQRVLDTTSQVLQISFPKADVRVVIYRATDTAPGARKLMMENRHGRKGKPNPFSEGDGARGDAAFKWLTECTSMFVDDLSERRLPGWRGSGKGYKTFISAAIHADGRPIGMLTVDAPTPGDLDETDATLIESFAALLAVAFALYTPKGRA
jgi:transcriptional regulator with GAF, ATPase, and Fis domain